MATKTTEKSLFDGEPTSMPVRIEHLRIEQFVGIEQLDVAPGKVNVISGANGSGKTSVLEAIATAISNEKPRPHMVHLGADRAVLLMELTDGTGIRRVVKEGSPGTVEVSQGGATFKGPQAKLASMFGSPDVFNPVLWLAKSDKEQAADLLRLVPLEITTEQYAALSGGELLPAVDYEGHPLKVVARIAEVLYQQRTGLNSEAKQARAVAESAAEFVPQGFDAESVRATELREMYAALTEAQKHNESIGVRTNLRHETVTKRLTVLDKIAALEQQITDLRANADALEAEILAHDDWINDADPLDLTDLEAAVASFEEQRATLAKYDEAGREKARAMFLEQRAADLTAQITAARALPVELLRATPPPVEGLAVDDAGAVTIHDLPLGNLSSSQKVDIAFKIAQARRGDGVPVVLVDGLEMLDPETREAFLAQAATDDCQYFVSIVSDGPLSVSSEG